MEYIFWQFCGEIPISVKRCKTIETHKKYCRELRIIKLVHTDTNNKVFIVKDLFTRNEKTPIYSERYFWVLHGNQLKCSH